MGWGKGRACVGFGWVGGAERQGAAVTARDGA